MAYRAALIGCGNIGSLYAEDPLVKGIYTHAGAYAACPEIELVAVCDANSEKAQMCAKRWNVASVYSDAAQLIQEQKPEIVSVCTPDATHAEIIERALNAPSTRAILAEKPLALDEKKAAYLVQLAKERGILLAVNYSRRYSSGHARIKKLITEGELGSIQSVLGFYTKGVLHNGTHWFDLARWLIGEVESVQGFSVGSFSEDATVNASLTFKNGAVGFLQGLDANAFSLFEMDILGTLGRIRLIDSGHRIECFKVSDSPYYTGYQTVIKTTEYDGELADTVLNAVMDLVFCLENGKEPQCSGLDGVAALRIAAASMKSAQQNSLKISLNAN